MKTLATLLQKQSGSISVCGIPIENAKAIRKIIGYLPQDFSIYPTMNVIEVMDYLGILSGIGSRERKKRIELLLKKVNLIEQKNKKVKALSGGMKRRLGIAQALLNDPSAFVPIIWQNVGYHMLLLYTSINSISKDILEAAKLDGASGVKAARYITIPLVKPMLRTCAIFVVIGSLKAFDMIYVLTNGGPAHMTEVPSSLMFSSIFNLNKYGYGSAISIFIVVECIVMAVILQKVFLVKEESA